MKDPEKQRQAVRERRALLVANGLCVNCGQAEAERSRRSCEPCNARRNALSEKYRAKMRRRAAHGYCAKCGGERDRRGLKLQGGGNGTWCRPCVMRQRAYKQWLCKCGESRERDERVCRSCVSVFGAETRIGPRLLGVLRDSDEWMTLVELADELGASTRNVLRRVQALVKTGWLDRREPVEEEGDAARYLLNDRGRLSPTLDD